MKVCVAVNNSDGLNSEVSLHFGQAEYFLIANIDNGEIKEHKIIENRLSHGGGACVAVDAVAAEGIDVMISGGMGIGAQQKFQNRGIKVYGFNGKAEDALKAVINGTAEGLDICKDGHHH